MTHPNGPDPDQADDEQFEQDRQALYDRIADFIEEEEIAVSYAVDLMIDVAVRLRMTAYALETEKPSVAGLKLDLDRMSRDVEEFVRDAKRDAPEFIEEVKAELAADADRPTE